MSDKPKPTVTFHPRPVEDLKLPPLVQRPYEQSSGSLSKLLHPAEPPVSRALGNIRV